MSDDPRLRELPQVLSPLALQVGLNMAVSGKLDSATTALTVSHAAEINADFDSWMDTLWSTMCNCAAGPDSVPTNPWTGDPLKLAHHCDCRIVLMMSQGEIAGDLHEKIHGCGRPAETITEQLIRHAKRS